ncbi:Nitrate/nitrite sensor protein NarX [Commensalibacter sp. Nvir]|uniref:histidine kinase n=1 Tax=Commensalibacter sp. Nvir TaxID=3069817 RepID=UPI002D501E1A|nr:Nitrate/nitrite sensor protein NarX [Commensalibacter sp. Nvir]
MLNPVRRYSLSTKLLIAVIARVICGMAITCLALALLWQLENGGVAINHAGSLRMHVYKLANLVGQSDTKKIHDEENNFISILETLKTTSHNVFTVQKNKKIKQKIDHIRTKFSQIIKNIIDHSVQLHQPISKENLNVLDQFVNQINDLVEQIENQNTKNIIWIRLMQGSLIGMIIITAFAEIYYLYQMIIRPLRYLQEGIAAISQGNLNKRVKIIRKDEFGIVSTGFNAMAVNLQDFYNNLEKKVLQKTADLEEKNQEFSILYDMSVFLHESQTYENTLQIFLTNVIGLSRANAGVIGLVNETRNNHIQFVQAHNFPKSCNSFQNCNTCFSDLSFFNSQIKPRYIYINDTNTVQLPDCIKKNFQYLIVFPLSHNNNKMGFMILYFNKDGIKPNSRNQHLIETLTRQLAVAIENHQLAVRDKQLAILEERNLIAQGLHDNIAQSLSFLNLQIQMLQQAIKKNETERISKNLNFIQKGIQECYDDVRELLLNFRTEINQDDFGNSIHKLLNRFKKQAKIKVTVEGLNQEYFLTQQQQLQVIFILQEALSNIRKHSYASNVHICFSNQGHFVMKVSDDGVGFNHEDLIHIKTYHVGLSIMEERAAKISASVKINSNLGEGTIVTLTFA